MCDADQEEAQHVIFECPRLGVPRQRILGYYSENDDDFKQWSVENLITFLRYPPHCGAGRRRRVCTCTLPDYKMLEKLDIEDET